MKRISEINAIIRDLKCDRELGWLQLRLLVLTLMNAMVPLSYNKKQLPLHYVKHLKSLYIEYLQVPFSAIDDTVFCLSIRNEVLEQIDQILSECPADENIATA